jgi:iron(III) transport system ATP-binding protein
MGDHCRYVIEANGQKLLATSSEALEVGMPVTVKVDTKGVLAF